MVTLSKIIEGLEMVNDMLDCYYNPEKDEIFFSDIGKYENNARTHSEEQIEKIARSIKEFGFINPVIIDGDYGIIAGHGRVLGTQKIGMKEVPCLFVEDLTETQKRAYIIADNKLALDAGLNDEILKQEIKALDDLNFDITLTGFDLEDFNFSEDDIEFEEDDYNVKEKLPEIPKAKYGDIYQLGEHRLMCGDSTSEEDIDKLVNGAEMDLCVTEPPYSVNIYAFLKAQKTGQPVELCCAIGDEEIDGKPYEEIVTIARKYIEEIGGFEKFAELGLF